MKSQHKSLDRISALPQDTIEIILNHMGIRDAVRTSILSKKWRYRWTTIPKLEFYDFMVVSSPDKELKKYKLINTIIHVLLLHTGPILEFSLFVTTKISTEFDLIILHLSRSNSIKKFDLWIATDHDSYSLPCSFITLQGLEHLYLSRCAFDHPLTNKGFCMLKSLRFFDVDISHKMLERFLSNCPLVEEFTWINKRTEIELSECELVELLKCLPSVQDLKISQLFIEHFDADRMPHKLPISLDHLRILDLEMGFLGLSLVLHVINNSPNLEKIKIEILWDNDEQYPFKSLLDPQEYSGLNLGNLKEMEITSFHNYDPEMKFVKLIMANSPVLLESTNRASL